MAKVIDCSLEGSDFKPQSRYYVFFRTKKVKKATLVDSDPKAPFFNSYHTEV